MAPRRGKPQQQEQVVLGPQAKEGENVFGVAHIFASFNDTFVHVTDLSGKYVSFYSFFFVYCSLKNGWDVAICVVDFCITVDLLWED